MNTPERFPNKVWKAYTLIELLVVMSIIAMLFSFGYVSYRDFSRRQELLGVAKSVQGNLRKAQQSALSGVKPDGSACNDQTLVGYDFYVVSSSEYQIRANCTGGNIVVLDVNLPTTENISTVTNPIMFKVLGNGTNLEADASIMVTQSSTGNTNTIMVGSGGDIN